MSTNTQITNHQHGIMNIALITFVTRELAGSYDAPSIKLDHTAGVLARYAFANAISPVAAAENEVPKAQVADVTRKAAELAYYNFAEFAKSMTYGRYAAIPLPAIGPVSDEDRELVARELDFPQEPSAPVPDEPLVAAWMLARRRHHHELQRMVALSYLETLVEDFCRQFDVDHALAEIAQAKSALLTRTDVHWISEYQLAILCGGEPLEVTCRELATLLSRASGSLTSYINLDKPGKRLEALKQALAERIDGILAPGSGT